MVESLESRVEGQRGRAESGGRRAKEGRLRTAESGIIDVRSVRSVQITVQQKCPASVLDARHASNVQDEVRLLGGVLFRDAGARR